ncbi:MAG: TolC family protein [Chitinophagaceae bacterium]
MKNKILLSCFLSFEICCVGQSKLLSLRQTVETAITNNLEVKQSGLQVKIAAASLEQIKSNLLPEVYADLGHGINQGRSIDPFTNGYINQQVNFANYSLGTNVILFNGGRLKNAIKQRALGSEASKLEFEQTKDKITLDVILSYVQILNNEDQLNQSRNQAAVTRNQVHRLEILNKEGAIAPAQLYDLKGQLANDELAIINNQNSLNSARLTLSQLMNVPFEKDLKVEKLSTEQFIMYENNPEEVYGKALKNLAVVKATEFRLQSAVKSVKVAKSVLYPSVALAGYLFTNYSSAAHKDLFLNTIESASGDFVEVSGNKLPVITQVKNYGAERIKYFNQFNNNYSTSVSIAINIPILNAFRARYQVRLAKLDLENAGYITESTRIQVKQLIEQSYFNRTAAHERYQQLLQQVIDFSESFRSAEVKFNAGASTQVDYLIAKNNLDRAKINLIIAKYDYILRGKVLDFYSGKLVL